MAKILLVEDDSNLADNVAQYLGAEHHLVETTSCGEDAQHLMRLSTYEIVILDLGLPDKNGLDVLRQYRSSGGTARVLILTGRDKIDEKEKGFDAGADDYLTKPFHVKELAARVRALLRRPGDLTQDVLKAGELSLNTKTYKVTLSGEDLKLTPREFALLEFFMRYPNQVFNAETILTRVWQSDSEASPDTIKVYINRLRTKLGESSDAQIKTVFGVGYKLDAQDKDR